MIRFTLFFLVIAVEAFNPLDKCALLVARTRGRRMRDLRSEEAAQRENEKLLSGAPKVFVLAQSLSLKISQILTDHAREMQNSLNVISRISESAVKPKLKLAEYAVYRKTFYSASKVLEAELKRLLDLVYALSETTRTEPLLITDFFAKNKIYRNEMDKLIITDPGENETAVEAFDAAVSSRINVNKAVLHLVSKPLFHWCIGYPEALSSVMRGLRKILILINKVAGAIQLKRSVSKSFITLQLVNLVLLGEMVSGCWAMLSTDARKVFISVLREMSQIQKYLGDLRFDDEFITDFAATTGRAFLEFRNLDRVTEVSTLQCVLLRLCPAYSSRYLQ